MVLSEKHGKLGSFFIFVQSESEHPFIFHPNEVGARRVVPLRTFIMDRELGFAPSIATRLEPHDLHCHIWVTPGYVIIVCYVN